MRLSRRRGQRRAPATPSTSTARRTRISAEHVMASGALPPGFPPVEIDGEYYWDGGIVSNTPLQYVLDRTPRMNALIFQVDLFSARGRAAAQPRRGAERAKDIQFQSKTRFNTDQIRRGRGAAQRAGATCSPSCRPSCAPIRRSRSSLSASRRDPVSHRPPDQSARHASVAIKDYEFSRATVRRALARPATPTSQHAAAAPRWLQASPTWATACASSTSSRRAHPKGAPHERRRSQEARLRDAAHQPGLSAGPLPLRQPRIRHHHLPHRSRRAARGGARAAARSTEPIVKYEFIRMPDSTGFGDYTETGQVIPVRFQRREGRLRPRDVPRRRRADRRRPRDLGLSQEARDAEAQRREGHAGRHAATTARCRSPSATMGYKHRALDPTPLADVADRAELPAQDHPARRRHAAHLRAGALLLRGRHGEGRLGRPGGAGALPPRACAGGALPVLRGAFRHPHPVAT